MVAKMWGSNHVPTFGQVFRALGHFSSGLKLLFLPLFPHFLSHIFIMLHVNIFANPFRSSLK